MTECGGWGGLTTTDGFSNSVTSLAPDHHFHRLRRAAGRFAGIIGSGQQPVSTVIRHAAAVTWPTIRLDELNQSLACGAAGDVTSLMRVRVFLIQLWLTEAPAKDAKYCFR